MSSKPLHLIPDWRGDETLYSWSARMHRLLGGATKETGQRLFGASHAYKEWAVSNRFEHLESVTGATLGSTRSILLERTVLAAYYPFLRAEQQEAFDARAATNARTSWLTRFAMKASALDAGELRWCHCCIQQEIKDGVTTRWRLPHQLPGAWWCVDHDLPLKRLHSGRAEWALPKNSGVTEDVVLNVEERQSLRTLSALAGSLVGQDRVNLISIKRALLSRLRDMGVVTSSKPVSSGDLTQWFASTYIAEAVRQAQPSILPLLDRPWIYETLLRRRANHPLLWMMIWVGAFEGMPQQEVIRGFHDSDDTLVWQEDGQGMLWIEARFQGDDRVQAIVRNAETLQQAALQLNVSVITLRRYMREAQCAPKSVRAAVRREVRQEAAVAEIEAFIREKSGVTKTDVHRLCKGAVSWLSRWQPELLASTLASIPEVRERQFLLEFGI